jgi:hypothetical protein
VDFIADFILLGRKLDIWIVDELGFIIALLTLLGCILSVWTIAASTDEIDNKMRLNSPCIVAQGMSEYTSGRGDMN